VRPRLGSPVVGLHEVRVAPVGARARGQNQLLVWPQDRIEPGFAYPALMSAEPPADFCVDPASLGDPKEPGAKFDGEVDVVEALQFSIVGRRARGDEAERAPRAEARICG
jgi:hypothetical protein